MTWWDFILDTIHTLLKNGITVSSAVAVLVLLLKNRKLKRYINNHLPARLRDRQEDDIAAIRRDVTAIKQHLGVEECQTAVTSVTTKGCFPEIRGRYSIFSWVVSITARFASRSTSSTMKNTRRKKRMKNYLKKLGRTKFQAYLLTTVVNLGTLFGMWLGIVDIGSQIEAYMPAITIVVQLLATGIYQFVEGAIDKEAQKQQVYVVPGSVTPPETIPTATVVQQEEQADPASFR